MKQYLANVYVYGEHDLNHLRMKCSERRQRNTTERQSNTTQLAQGNYFSKKKTASGGI